jgi:uncharacterized iron-regulated membrane protein
MPRISLRHLFALVTLAALAVVSLKYASAAWAAILPAAAMIVFVAAVIVAIVGRGPGQAFAIGMVVVTAAYGVLRYLETTPNENRVVLPTTSALVALQNTSSDVRAVNPRTGNVLGTPPQPGSFTKRFPELHYFLPIGHAWFALLFGYLGGHFAQFVYSRRAKDRAAK